MGHEKGKVSIDGKTRDVFKRAQELEDIGLGVPQITKFMMKLKERDNSIRDTVLTVEEAKEEILKLIRSRKNA